MSLTLGEKLRQAREARGITIREVAEQTRISALYLEAIENNDYRSLPGGIFNKGFVKSYAKQVGVDEQEALQDYNQLVAEQGEISDEPKSYRPEVLTDERSRSSLLPTIIFAVIILGLMVWGILALRNWYENSRNQPVANTNANKSVNIANSNVNAGNTNTTQNIPINEIKVEFKSSAPISVTSTVDGNRKTETVPANEPKTYTAQQSLKLSYYKGFADKVQLTINGKPITPPPAPARGSVIEFEINKDNIAQMLQSGLVGASVSPVTPSATPRPKPLPKATPKATPKPVPTATPAKPRPAGNANVR
ncbi:MAG: helix-turn-helix domain-containing protein [Pyrinomonadaceae bacterium]